MRTFYLSGANLRDPFTERGSSEAAWWAGSMVWQNYQDMNRWNANVNQQGPFAGPQFCVPKFPRYLITSIGPDLLKNNDPKDPAFPNYNMIYDPSNGTVSYGNIIRTE
jgi:hypothetical protein